MHTFFRLLLTSSSHVVAQLTAPVESGVRKADPYMPTAEAPAVTFTPLPSTSPSSAPPVTLRLVRQTWQAAEQATVSTLELASEGSPTKQVTHVYFAGWKDKGVPEGRDGLETLLRYVCRLPFEALLG
jgi:protein tyrosine phosphatase